MHLRFRNITCVGNLEDKLRTMIEWFDYFTSGDISVLQLVLTLGIACVNAAYIFVLYRILGRKTIYSKRFSITISGVLVVTTAIIFATYSNVTLSLGVIGALAIIRFRTAIKDSLDIVYLLWSVTAGVCYGAHMAEVAIVLAAFLTVLIMYLQSLSVKEGCRILIIERDSASDAKEISTSLRKYARGYKIKTTEQSRGIDKTVIELRTKQEYQLIREITQINGVQAVSLIAQKNEHSY